MEKIYGLKAEVWCRFGPDPKVERQDYITIAHLPACRNKKTEKNSLQNVL